MKGIELYWKSLLAYVGHDEDITCNRARMKASWLLIKESGQAEKHLKTRSEFASCSATKIALVYSLNFRYCSAANSNICLLSMSSLKNIVQLFYGLSAKIIYKRSPERDSITQVEVYLLQANSWPETKVNSYTEKKMIDLTKSLFGNGDKRFF